MLLIIFLGSNTKSSSTVYSQRHAPLEASDADGDAFAVVCDIGTGTRTCFGSESRDVVLFTNGAPVLKPSIVFLRGYASPDWINAIGWRLNLGPGLFQRHLNFGAFRGFRNFYCTPSLPSASTRVFQLIVPTVYTTGRMGNNNEPETLQREREKISSSMRDYTKDLRPPSKNRGLCSSRVHIAESRGFCAGTTLDN